MKILLICSSYNGLTQRVHDELINLEHEVSIELSLSETHMKEAVELFEPELILCPFLKEKIPSDIYENYLTIIFHPGIMGDRGPSSLDWAILNEHKTWGITLLQANEHMDAGDIWEHETFDMTNDSKAYIYKNQVTNSFIIALKRLLPNVKNKKFKPLVLDYNNKKIKGQLHLLMKQNDRKIDWDKDNSETIIRKINCADSFPGVKEEFFGTEYFLFGAHNESKLKNIQKPKEIIARRNGAICISTIDGAIWISHLRQNIQPSYKVPATVLLMDKLKGIYENRLPLVLEDNYETFKEIYYEQEDEIGYLYFDFHNGAMSIEQCVRLKYAYEYIREEKDIKVLVLMGGKDSFSNGIHLNNMEDSLKKAEDGWSNIHAMNDIVKEIIHTPNLITVSALRSNAGAGGVILALASDYVVMKEGVILNPHYKTLGLHGSEYWTYLLPKRVGQEKALELTNQCLPIGAKRAKNINLIDEIFSEKCFDVQLKDFCENLKEDDFFEFLDKKEEERQKDEQIKPLESYRKEELAFMYQSFYDKNSEFNQLRCDFVYKRKSEHTPSRLALHRQKYVK